jgi:hypothetical protein
VDDDALDPADETSVTRVKAAMRRRPAASTHTTTPQRQRHATSAHLAELAMSPISAADTRSKLPPSSTERPSAVAALKAQTFRLALQLFSMPLSLVVVAHCVVPVVAYVSGSRCTYVVTV